MPIPVRAYIRARRPVRAHVREGSGAGATPINWVLPVDLEASKHRAFDEGGFAKEDWRDPILTWMSPQAFAGYDQATPVEDREMRATLRDVRYPGFEESFTNLVNRLRRGLPIDPPAVAIGLNGKEYLWNGNHRLNAAYYLGIKKIPVWVFRAKTSRAESKAEFFRKRFEREWEGV